MKIQWTKIKHAREYLIRITLVKNIKRVNFNIPFDFFFKQLHSVNFKTKKKTDLKT